MSLAGREDSTAVGGPRTTKVVMQGEAMGTRKTASEGPTKEAVSR